MMYVTLDDLMALREMPEPPCDTELERALAWLLGRSGRIAVVPCAMVDAAAAGLRVRWWLQRADMDGGTRAALVRCDVDWIRSTMARRVDLSFDDVALLARDAEWWVRELVAQRSGLAPEVVAALRADPHARVRASVERVHPERAR